ncbi:MAG TPA: ATP-binding protein [Acidimicrobiales bacterium]|nr:ATP-binding protein [Acidimicrobiales bacterium]
MPERYLEGSTSSASVPEGGTAPSVEPRAAPASGPRVLMFPQSAVASALAVALVVALGAVMFPFRSHMSVATTALVLVVPVVVGVATGGFVAGIVGMVTGFLVYDFVFIPPYYTLSVGAAQNWTALVVYAVVMVVVARVVARVNAARAEAQRRATEARRLFDLSELLVRDSSMPELLRTIVTTVRSAFDLDGAALILPVDGRLHLVASAGVPLSDPEIRRLTADAKVPVSLETASVQRGGVQAVPLKASDHAIGLLALRGLRGTGRDHEPLRTFSNHLALALERAQLREQAVRAQLLEEVDRLRRSLVGAVSHDLRTPLATIKVAASALIDTAAPLSAEDSFELAGLIDVQADRLDRLVANVLDMTRIESGALELRRRPTTVTELVDEALSILGPSQDLERVECRLPANLPRVDVDHVLICQVLANLVDNGTRYSPSGTTVTVSAACGGNGQVEVAVTDRGPGVPAGERTGIFEMFNRREAGGRGGLGLAIAQAFVEVHGQRIWVEEPDGGGARFVFTLPASDPA